jgi:hypothetical protein
MNGRNGKPGQNCLHTFPIEARGACHGQQHARLRGVRSAGERCSLWQHQVYARRAHPTYGTDGARQLALQRPRFIDPLLELGGAQRIGAVEDFVADGAAGRQPLFRQQHTGLWHLIGGYHDSGARRFKAIRDMAMVKLIDDLRRIAQIEISVEQGHGLC